MIGSCPGDGASAVAWPELTAELRRFVARRLDQDVDDVVQETLMRVHRHLPELRADERLGPWAYRIARNAIIDHHRARALALRRKAEDELATAETVAEEANLNRVVARWLLPMIDDLEDPYREALVLIEIEGLSQAKLARRLGLSPSGARTRVQRARQKLRGVIERCCAITTDSRGNVIDVSGRDNCC